MAAVQQSLSVTSTAALPNQESALSTIANNVEQSTRAVGKKWKGEKKKKYKMFKEHYKKSITPAQEFTKAEDKKDTAFVPVELKGTERSAIGAGVIYPTSELAKDQKHRIQLGIAPRGVISSPLNVYSSSDIILVSLSSADQFFGTLSVGAATATLAQMLEVEAIKKGFADFATWKAAQANAANAYEQAATQLVGVAGAGRTFNVPFLRGVSTFLPLIAPPKDKAMEDYLNDVKRFGLGSPITAIQQALGQATYRALFTVRQTGLNQAFMLTESTFYRMSTKPTADPMTTVKEPRIAMFYKKFLDCDDSLEKTIPGGKTHYDNIAGSKDYIEDIMKVFLSSPTFGERLVNFTQTTSNAEVNAAFQNLQIHEDVHEMIKHIMYSTFINLVTCIADVYIMGNHWENTAPVGSFAGYPPGFIMPCHLYMMMQDAAFSYKVDVNAKKGHLQTVGDAKAAQTLRDEMYGVDLPLFQTVYNMRKAFLVPLDNSVREITRLHQDGTEWLNSLTPNRSIAVLAKNAETDANFRNSHNLQDKRFAMLAKASPINSSTISVDLEVKDNAGTNLSLPSNKIRGKNVANTLNKTLERNAAIWTAIQPYVQQDMAPTGPQIFNSWKMQENQIYQGSGEENMVSRGLAAGQKFDLATFRNKQQLANSAINSTGMTKLKQGAGGNLRTKF